jgi:hypothetical protein
MGGGDSMDLNGLAWLTQFLWREIFPAFLITLKLPFSAKRLSVC